MDVPIINGVAQNNIKPGIFYSWVSKLCKSRYVIPDSVSKSSATAVSQKVVKVDLVHQTEVSTLSIDQNACGIPANETPTVAAELVLGQITLRLYNGADSELIRNTVTAWEVCFNGSIISLRSFYYIRNEENCTLVDQIVTKLFV